MTEKPLDNRPPGRRPIMWDKMVSAAYLRMLGATWKQTAKAVGRHAETVRTWTRRADWQQARQEARSRWLVDVEDHSRGRLLRELQNAASGAHGGRLALSVLERLDPDMAPPAVRAQVDWRFEVLQRLEAMPRPLLRQIAEAADDQVLGLLGMGDEGDGDTDLAELGQIGVADEGDGDGSDGDGPPED